MTEDKMENKKDESGEKVEAMEWVKSIVIAVVIALFIKNFIFSTTLVSGDSMNPSLHHGDRLISIRVPLYFSYPDRGDVVLLDAPDKPGRKYVKRVIGLPGDRIAIDSGQVYLNDQELEEAYIEEASYTSTYDIQEWEVKDGEVFVLGDNRLEGASKDSRYFGKIDKKSVKGIIKFRYYPFDSSFGKIK